MGKRNISVSEDAYSDNAPVSDSDDQSYAPTHRTSTRKTRQRAKKKTKHDYNEPLATAGSQDSPNLCDDGLVHSISTHRIEAPAPICTALLQWYSGVHESRGMPWRKPYNPSLSPEKRAQRAYEVWISEIMLQQTQVSTVIPYYNRWMERFPTICDLAAASLDEVNSLWKGLGYYTRASRLLSGAQKAVKQYGGRLPDNAKEMEVNIPGIGRYSAGAICSIAYGERVPVLDGNVHRLLSRFLALHAPPKAKATLDILWSAADAMVRGIDLPDESKYGPSCQPNGSGNNKLVLPGNDSASHGHKGSQGPVATGYPGDINQALIELGSTVCKVRDPNCGVCPLRRWCAGYAMSVSAGQDTVEIPTQDIEDACTLCEPLPTGSKVTAYPMKIERKQAREELDVVNVVEWRSKADSDERLFLLVRRPEGGLLAGLHEFPTSPNIAKTTPPAAILEIAHTLLSKILKDKVCLYEPAKPHTCHVEKPALEPMVINNTLRITKLCAAGDVVHVFSHIRKTYRVQWVLLEGGNGPPELRSSGDSQDEERAIARPGAKGGKARGKGKANEGGLSKGQEVCALTTRTAAMWAPLGKVVDANIGTGVVKVWNLAKTLWERA